LIEVRDLTKRYGSFLAVDRVSFDVAEGEVVGFLGPNGAGKSTTMKMLTCYFPPTSGTAKVAGFDIFHQSEQVRRELGYLPENCPLYHEMKVTEYLHFRGRLRGLSGADRKKRIGEVLEKCWLTNVQGRLIGHLSKGYRQRVGLADALLHDPKVLILDEPTVGLDPTQIRETRKLVKGLGKAGGGKHTVMLSTHILPEVEAVCSRVIVIAGGKVAAQGTPEELRTGGALSGGSGGGGGGGGGGVAGVGRVLVELRVDFERGKQLLQSVPGVARVELARREDGLVTFAVTPKSGQDLREEIVRSAVTGGVGVREIRNESRSLEEFFVQVTAQQAVAGAAGETSMEPVAAGGAK
jgi:ABC-2 type transport system ATP-binding protein